jgi:hypothetical protein
MTAKQNWQGLCRMTAKFTHIYQYQSLKDTVAQSSVD